MSFLSKLGNVLARIVGIVTGIGPLVEPFLGSGKAATVTGTVVNDLTSIGQVVVQAEALIQGTGTGATKLAAATPLVAQIILTSEMVSGKKIANDALFIQGAGKVTSGIADVLNAIDPSEVKTSGPSLTPPPSTTPVKS